MQERLVLMFFFFFLSSFCVEYFFIFFSLCFEMPCILSLKFNPLVLLHLMDFLFLSLSWIYCILDTIRNAKNCCNNCLWCKKCLDFFLYLFSIDIGGWKERENKFVFLMSQLRVSFSFYFFWCVINVKDCLNNGDGKENTEMCPLKRE